MRHSERKVLVIPYIRVPNKRTRLLVVQHAESGDWTFISGTCQRRESPDRCVVRELAEETRGLVHVRCIPKRAIRFRAVVDQKRVDVYFLPLRMKEQEMVELVRTYDFLGATLPSNQYGYFENAQLSFQTLAQFKRRKNIWEYVKAILDLPAFHEHCPLSVQ